jgi:hypothetical protein
MFFYEDRTRTKKKAGVKSLNFLCLAKRDVGRLWQWWASASEDDR